METILNHDKLELLHVRLHFQNKLVVNKVGRSGGLCLFWNDTVEVQLLTFSQNHIDVGIRSHTNISWRFTRFYGHLETSKRTQSWDLLRRLKAHSNLSWLCGGDFNKIIYGSILRIVGLIMRSLHRWNQNQARLLKSELRRTKRKLEVVNSSLIDFSWTYLRHLEEKLDKLFSAEEKFWQQRAHQQWMTLGDKNTKFFLYKVSQKRKKNGIKWMFDD
ncbi:hypothetical protein ACOSQ2_020850 [Xanthoceras sorbifolium]